MFYKITKITETIMALLTIARVRRKWKREKNR